MVKRILALLLLFLTFSFSLLNASELKKITTNYFSIIFDGAELASANTIASFADQQFEELVEKLDYQPKERIVVLLAGNYISSNGFFSPLKPKIVLYTIDTDSRLTGQRTESYLKALFRHELTHYIHLTEPSALVKYLRPIFGPASAILNTFLMPLWWIEGIATYHEQGRLHSKEFELLYHSPIAEKRVINLAKGSYHSPVEPYNRPYAIGLMTINYLFKNYQEGSFAKINRSFTKNPILGINRAFKNTIGISAKELYKKAADEIEKGYVDYQKPNTYSPATDKNFYLPFYTEKGLIGLGYSASVNGFIYDYENNKVLAKNLPFSDRHSAKISSDGTTLYFSFMFIDSRSMKNNPIDNLGYADIYSYDIESKKYRQLTFKERLKQPHLNKEQTKLTAIEPIDSVYQIVLIDLETQNKSVLYRSEEGSLYEPLFSFDEQSILAIEVVKGKSSLIQIKDSAAKTLIGPTEATLSSVTFLDQNNIYFSSDYNNKLALYSYNFESGITKEVADDTIGILAGIKVKDKLIYLSYSNDRYVLRSLSDSELKGNETEFVKVADSLISLKENKEYPVSSFRDYPNYNFWLPLPLSDNLLSSIGVSLYLQSLYERHTLLFCAAWAFKDKEALFTSLYNYRRGPFDVSFQYDSKLPYKHKFGLSINTHLYNKTKPSGSNNLYLTTSAGFNIIGKSNISTLFGSLTYLYYSLSPADSYWGNYRFQLSGSFQWDKFLDSGASFKMPTLFVYTQIPLGSTNQVLSLQSESVYFGQDFREGIIKPSVLKIEEKTAEAKSLITLMYQIPFKGVDWPVLNGGITGLRGSLYLETIVDLKENSLLWEKELYGGISLETDLAIASSLKLTPYATFAFSFINPNFGFQIGLKMGNIILGVDRPRDTFK